jgi:ABC-type oligopeptide transport system substrate-binding subunit
MIRMLAVLAALAGLTLTAAPAAAQDRAKTKEIVVAFAAEPRTLLPDTIVDWTTNNMVEHMYDRLVDRDPKTYKPSRCWPPPGRSSTTPPGSSPSARG